MEIVAITLVVFGVLGLLGFVLLILLITGSDCRRAIKEYRKRRR